MFIGLKGRQAANLAEATPLDPKPGHARRYESAMRAAESIEGRRLATLLKSAPKGYEKILIRFD